MSSQSFFETILPKKSRPEQTAKTAERKADMIVRHAIKEAESSITQAHFFHKSLRDSLKDELKRALDTSMTEFQVELQKQLTQMMDEYKSTLMKEVHAVHTLLHSNMEKELSEMRADIQTYKEQQKKSISEELKSSLEQYIDAQFDVEIPPRMKETIITKALERAQKHGFFSKS